ncbi:hypothetical protein GQ53DRAFT_790590 [Thozetella sp. PMI_491]|nr:hypothetical protein GQ53DRAFT_790590 [Thozetella sp. PMI_491]
MAPVTPPPRDVKSAPSEHIRRGHFNASPIGTTTVVIGRALDPFLQYRLINGWGASFLSKLGLAVVPAAVPAFHTGISALDSLGLSLPRLVVLAMSVGSAAKHILWATALSNEELTPQFAVMISGYNAVLNTANALFFVAAATSSSLASPQISIPGTGATVSLPVVLGTLLYTAGIAIETVSEIQRKQFKDRPENKGKICTTGLWGWARHINYTGYTMWRTGFALAAGGWIPAALIFAMQSHGFLTRSIGSLDSYMTEKYGEQWAKYNRNVPWKIFPGIY